MAERIAVIDTPQETLNKFAEETLQNGFFSRYIADRDSALVANALIEAGMMNEGDTIKVSFVVDKNAVPDSQSRNARIYTACKIPNGEIVETSFIGEYTLDIDCDNDN
jgi:hypothetical protein